LMFGDKIKQFKVMNVHGLVGLVKEVKIV